MMNLPQEGNLQELLRYIIMRYHSDSNIIDHVTKLLGLNHADIENIADYLQKGSLDNLTLRDCLRLSDVLIRRLGLQPVIIISKDEKDNVTKVRCMIKDPSNIIASSIRSLYESIRWALIELTEASYLMLRFKTARASKSPHDFWLFDLGDYVNRVYTYIRNKLKEILSTQCVMLDDRGVYERFKNLGICRDVYYIITTNKLIPQGLQMLKSMINVGEGHVKDLEQIFKDLTPNYICLIEPTDEDLLVSLLFTVFNELTLQEIQKDGAPISVKVRLEILSDVLRSQEIKALKPYIEHIDREIQKHEFDVIKHLEHNLFADYEVLKQVIRHDFISRFLRMQAVGKKTYNERSLYLYLVFHAVLSMMLLYELIRIPENINAYFMTCYKHFTEGMKEVLSDILTTVVRRREADFKSLNDINDSLKDVLSFIWKYPELILAISKYISLLDKCIKRSIVQGFLPNFKVKKERDKTDVVIELPISNRESFYLIVTSTGKAVVTSIIIQDENKSHGFTVSSRKLEKEEITDYIKRISDYTKTNLRVTDQFEENIWRVT